jgi:predicted RNase H-like HicB family nuclease
MNRKSKIDLIIEHNRNGYLWGRIEDKGNFIPTGQGKTVASLIKNVKDSIEDYIEHEGKTDPFWGKVDLNSLEFNVSYDIKQFLKKEFECIKITNVGRMAGINESLMRQYATGIKYPSLEQAKKIFKTINSIGRELQKVAIHA